MELTFTDGGVYIPDWNDNKKQIESEQIKIHWKYPTNEDRNRIRSFTVGAVSGKKDPKVEFKLDHHYLVRCCILRIENLKINGEEINSAERLIGNRLTGQLYDELKTFFMGCMDVDFKTKKK